MQDTVYYIALKFFLKYIYIYIYIYIYNQIHSWIIRSQHKIIIKNSLYNNFLKMLFVRTEIGLDPIWDWILAQ